MARRYRTDLKESSIYVLMQYVYKNEPEKFGVRVVGGSNPREFHYENGSVITTRGLDDPQGALGGAYDFVFISQAEELTEKQWNILVSRVSGRAGNAPYSQLIADANPGPPHHFLMHRENLKTIASLHKDNPEIYDQKTGELLESGAPRIAALHALTGVEKERLLHGRWVAAEGLVYDDFDPNVHVIPNVKPGGPRYLSIDFGFNNPFVCQWWKIDEDGRMIMTRELYKTGMLVEDAARIIERVCRENEEWVLGVVCDHDAEGRATLERHFGTNTIPAIKGKGSVVGGIDLVKSRLALQKDGKPRLYICSDATIEVDRTLIEKRQPTSTRQEFGTYMWKEGSVRNDNIYDEPEKKYDHALDALRYMVLFFDYNEPKDVIMTYRRPLTVSRY